MEAEAAAMQPKIQNELEDLIYEKLITPFVNLISEKTMDCSFLAATYQDLLDGMCYGLGGAIAGYANIFKMLAGCGFLLVFLNFGLWYHFCCMHAAAVKEAEPKDEKDLGAVPGEGA
jgi:hypothetical protein